MRNRASRAVLGAAILTMSGCAAETRARAPEAHVVDGRDVAMPALAEECVTLGACARATERALCTGGDPCEYTAVLDFHATDAASCTRFWATLEDLLQGLETRVPDFARPEECAASGM